MKDCNEFLDRKSPKQIRVIQVTEDPKGASLVYPDLPCFLQDGRSLIIHTSAGPTVCRIDEKFALHPLFDDPQHRHVVVSSDGRYAFSAERSSEGTGTLTIRRTDLETFRTEDIFHAAGLLKGTDVPVHKFHPATVSSDNRRLAATVFLGDGTTRDAPYGIVSLDLVSGEACLAAAHRDFGNSHLQYCRSTDTDASHDLLIQMNHGARSDENGRYVVALGPPQDRGVDIHVVHDDGSNWRDLPFGRDGKESCIGHQMWRGTGTSVITVTLQNADTSYGWADGTRQEVVEGWPVPADPDADHRGRLHPGARRRFLSEGFPKPRFCHLNVSPDGRFFAFDTFPIFDKVRAGMRVYAARDRHGEGPLEFLYLVNSGVTFNGCTGYHAHPVVSPDGRTVLFNSNLSGSRQVYAVTGVEF